MKTLVMYDSKFGNTERVAKVIAGQLGEQHSVHVTNVDGEIPSIEDFDLVVIGGPTHAHGMSALMRRLLEDWPRGHIYEISVAVFDTRLHIPVTLSGSAAASIASNLNKRAAVLLVPPESFFVTRDGHLGDGEDAHAISWAQSILNAMQPSPREVSAAR